jgi:hypothetical protein
MPKPAHNPTIFPATTRVAVLELSEFFTYRELGAIVGRDASTVRQWPDRPREAREPHLSRLMMTYEIVSQLLMWSREPDIAAYFRTPYDGHTVTQVLRAWTRIDKYDDLIEVLAYGPEHLIKALVSISSPTETARRSTPRLEQPLEHAGEEGRRFVTALADISTIRADGTLGTQHGDIGMLRMDRVLLYPTPTLQLVAPPKFGTSEQKQREHFARVFRTLGWLRPSASGKSTRVVRTGEQVRRVWDLPAAILLEPARIAASLSSRPDAISTS